MSSGTISLKRSADESISASSVPTPCMIPGNLKDLSQAELIQLVQQLASERDVLKLKVQVFEVSNKKLKQPVASLPPIMTAATVTAAAAYAPPAVISPTSSQVIAVRKRLGKAAAKAIKKATHGGSKKPISEVSEGNISSEMANALMEYNEEDLLGFVQISDTSRMTKWKAESYGDGDILIAKWLCTDRLIHPVKHDGKGYITFGGGKPKIYAYAGYDSIEIKYDKREKSFSLKIKSFQAGSGKGNANLEAFSKFLYK